MEASKTVTLEGVKLTLVRSGFWKTADGVLFQRMPSVRMGLQGRRYSLQRWISPDVDGNSGSLRQAVRKWKQAQERKAQSK
jgi:hypothetical protein